MKTNEQGMIFFLKIDDSKQDFRKTISKIFSTNEIFYTNSIKPVRSATIAVSYIKVKSKMAEHICKARLQSQSSMYFDSVLDNKSRWLLKILEMLQFPAHLSNDTLLR